MNERRSLWWLWVIGGLVALVVIAGAVWILLVNPARQTASASASGTPVATAPAATTPPSTRTPLPTATTPTTAAPTPAPTSAPPTAAPESPPPVAAVTAVTPFIVSAGWSAADGGIGVSSNVPQIVESDGTCTITATSGAATVSASFAAQPSAVSTDCGSQVLASPQLTSGTWSVVVSYSSSTSSGQSAAMEVTVP